MKAFSAAASTITGCFGHGPPAGVGTTQTTTQTVRQGDDHHIDLEVDVPGTEPAAAQVPAPGVLARAQAKLNALTLPGLPSCLSRDSAVCGVMPRRGAVGAGVAFGLTSLTLGLFSMNMLPSTAAGVATGAGIALLGGLSVCLPVWAAECCCGCG